MNLHRIIILAPFILFSLHSSALHADLFYWPSEYLLIINDRDALQIELDSLKSQYRNEKADLEAKITELNAKIESLDKQRADLDRVRAEEKIRAQEQIRALESRTAILEKSGGEREKQLIAENNRLKVFYDDQLDRLQKQLADEQALSQKKIVDLTLQFEKKRSGYEIQISQLSDQISALKKLSQAQKDALDRMSKQATELENQLQAEIKNGDIKIKRLFNKIIININDRISFDSGSAVLKPNVKPSLDKIITILRNYSGNRISVEGHTDDVPLIPGSQIRDNWQLSTERALSVLNYIIADTKIDPARYSASGFGKYQPLVPNDSSENRAQNRRVDIVVIPNITEERQDK